MSKGQATQQAAVTVEMGLFVEHHVGIQDGPTLCANKLAADLAQNFTGEHQLTTEDLQAHTQQRAAAEARRSEARAAAGRRRHTPPGAYETPRDRS